MKKMIMGLCLMAATGVVCAQNAHSSYRQEVPIGVMESFHKDYPDASAVHWNRTDGKWNAEFVKMTEHKSMYACYDTKGRHIDTRMTVAQSAVPTKVIRHLDADYHGRYSHEFTRIERPGKRDLYKVKVKRQGVSGSLYVDDKGHEKDYASR